ncbi:MAG: hypothetical protein H0V66_03770 [Bdellovibrionales bacterium]|nr:hypothetical protein [Bdellovibrionales bacterium]
MKKLIIVVYSVLAFVFEAQAVQITGKGFSPTIENDSSLSRMLATWDAMSDALVKTQGTLNGSLSLENDLIKNHRITYRNDFGSVKLIERSCDMNAKQVTCSIIIDVQNSRTQESSAHFEIKECSFSSDGVELCYKSEARSYKESSFGITAELETRVQVQWNLEGSGQVLYAETVATIGLGKTRDSSFKSGILQALFKIRKQKIHWIHIFSSFKDLQLMKIGKKMDPKIEMHLKLMGAQVFEFKGQRYILLPSVIAKS